MLVLSPHRTLESALPPTLYKFTSIARPSQARIISLTVPRMFSLRPCWSFSVLLVRIAAAVNDDNYNGLPDFSSYQYPGQPAERSFEPSYDFCVVGGGTAGLVLGNRLSESGKHTVVVFEAGGPPTDMRTYSPPGGNIFALNGSVNSRQSFLCVADFCSRCLEHD